MSSEVIHVEHPELMDISLARDPQKIMDEAMRAAKVLKDVISRKPNPVKFNGEQYLEFEDWQTVGKFYGLTARIVDDHFIDLGGVIGFEATADVIDGRNGAVISSARAMCLNDEDNWSTRTKYEWKDVLDAEGNKIIDSGKTLREKVEAGTVPVPLFQLKSMAQTRACAKALRNVLAWVVVLAGYRPSVAEEMIGDERDSGHSSSRTPKANTAAGVISEPQRARAWAIGKNSGLTAEQYRAVIKKHGFASDKEIPGKPKSIYDAICAELEGASNAGSTAAAESNIPTGFK